MVPHDNLIITLAGKGPASYLVVAFLVPTFIFIFLSLILAKAYKKKNQIGAKGIFVSLLVAFNAFELLLFIFYIIHTKATAHLERNTLILNSKIMWTNLILMILVDFSLLIAWFINPTKLNPNSWQWLWAMRESHIQAKYERERERKMKEYQQQMRENAGETGDEGKKSKRKGKRIDDLLYRYLGLDTDASSEEIKTAYRSLAKKYHPDTSTEENAVEMFMKIQKAYEVLNDETRRANYDQTGKY